MSECRLRRCLGKLREHQPRPTPCGNCMYSPTTTLTHFFRTRAECTHWIRTSVEDQILFAPCINPVNNWGSYALNPVCNNRALPSEFVYDSACASLLCYSLRRADIRTTSAVASWLNGWNESASLKSYWYLIQNRSLVNGLSRYVCFTMDSYELTWNTEKQCQLKTLRVSSSAR